MADSDLRDPEKVSIHFLFFGWNVRIQTVGAQIGGALSVCTNGFLREGLAWIHMSNQLNKSLTSVAKGAGILFAGLIVGNVLGMVNQIILGRYLGPEKYGLFNLALSIVVIGSTLAVFGFFGSLARFIPFHLDRDVGPRTALRRGRPV